MKKNVKKILLLVLFSVFFIVFANAQTENPIEDSTESKPETIIFYADKMHGSTSKASELVKLTGRAYIKTNTMEIYADEIELTGNNYRTINALGNIRGKNLESGFDFTCGNLLYDRESKIAVLHQSVTMDDPENQVKAKAQLMEYNQNTETAIFNISVELIKKENICTAAFAIYRKKQKMLEMSGRPQVIRGEDTFRAQEIVFNLDTEEISLIGKVSGSVTDSEEKE